MYTVSQVCSEFRDLGKDELLWKVRGAQCAATARRTFFAYATLARDQNTNAHPKQRLYNRDYGDKSSSGIARPWTCNNDRPSDSWSDRYRDEMVVTLLANRHVTSRVVGHHNAEVSALLLLGGNCASLNTGTHVFQCIFFVFVHLSVCALVCVCVCVRVSGCAC